MNKLVKLVVVASLFVSGLSYGNSQKADISQLPKLQQEAHHAVVSQRVVNRLVYSHFQQFKLNNAFSERIFARYLDMLDYRHDILLASDIESFAARKTQLDDELRSGQLTTAYALYNLSLERRLARYQYALSLLNSPITFDTDDVMELDRAKAPWPGSTAELDALWQQRVKLDALNLKIAGKSWAETKDILTKRYQSRIKQLNQTSSEDVFQTFMNAFARELDPHTSYLSPKNTDQFNAAMNLSFSGIGATLQMSADMVQIVSLIPGGPAAVSKQLKVGDRIIGVGQDNKPIVDVVGWNLDDIIVLIKGPKGSKVRLEILPAGVGTKSKIITVVRDEIKLEDGKAKKQIKTVDGQKVAVITISSFYLGLTKDVEALLAQLPKDISALVIDLRGNGGGALNEVVTLSGLFIPQGPVVQVKSSDRRIHLLGNAGAINVGAQPTYYLGPMVVLVDSLSASASEIFAAAMQDYGRALVVGETTFGKGTVQKSVGLIRPFDWLVNPDWKSLGTLLYTNEKFYRVNGGSTQLKGVTPDIQMLGDANIMNARADMEIGEAYESNPLPWDSIKPASYKMVADLKAALPAIIKNHKQRLSNDPEFQFILEDIALYQEKRERRNLLSLNYAQRKKESSDNEQRVLSRVNDRRALLGQPAIKSYDEIPKDYLPPDPYLDETIAIALELAAYQQDNQPPRYFQ